MSKYKLVPAEPTREMWAAAGDAVVALDSQHHDAISEAVYKAMLAAAPDVEQAPEVAKLVDALEGLLKIADESLGVSGYHLNGNMAKWCEFEEVEMAEEALALYRQKGGDL